MLKEIEIDQLENFEISISNWNYNLEFILRQSKSVSIQKNSGIFLSRLVRQPYY